MDKPTTQTGVKVFKDLETGELFRTNYIDYYNGYIFSPRGLIKDNEVIEDYVTRKEFEKIKVQDYKINRLETCEEVDCDYCNTIRHGVCKLNLPK